MSRQTIKDYTEARDSISFKNDNGLEDYMAMKEDIDQFLTFIAEGMFSPQFGQGSPEGVVTSNLSKQYIDTDTNTVYYNLESSVNTGWFTL
jgi:hypothetical protein